MVRYKISAALWSMKSFSLAVDARYNAFMKYSLRSRLFDKRLRGWRLWFFGAVGIGLVSGIGGAAVELTVRTYRHPDLFLISGAGSGVLTMVMLWWLSCPDVPLSELPDSKALAPNPPKP